MSKNKKGLIISKKFHSLYYIENRYRDACEEEKDLIHFKDFKCSSVFQGFHLSKLNLEEYNKRTKINDRELKILNHIWKRMKEK